MLASIALLIAAATAQTQDCTAFFKAQETALATACGNDLVDVIDGKITQPKAIADQILKSLPSTCSATCTTALSVSVKAVKASSCATAPVVAGNTNAQLITYLQIYQAIACVKTSDQKGYCLSNQSPTLLAAAGSSDLNSAAVALLQDKTLVCTECFKNQLTAVLAIPDLPADIKTGAQPLNSLQDTLCKDVTISTAAASPTSSSNSVIGNTVSSGSLALMLAAMV